MPMANPKPQRQELPSSPERELVNHVRDALSALEGEPSFRYTVTPSACAPQDLLVVVPWHLKNVLSGEPVVYKPYIEQARHVAELRNWFWTHTGR